MSDRQLTNALGETLPVNLARVVVLQPVMKAWATYESHLIESGLCGERRILGKTRCWRPRQVKTADEFRGELTMLQISLAGVINLPQVLPWQGCVANNTWRTAVPVLRVAGRQLSKPLGN